MSDRVARMRRRALLRMGVSGGLGAALAGGGLYLLFRESGGRWAGAALGSGAIALGVASATLAKHLLPPPDATEERHAPGTPACLGCDHGISARRRRLLIGGAAGIAAALTGGLLFRNTGAEQALRSTAWRRGDRLVTLDGRPIMVDDLEVGAMLTAWPEHAIRAADAQVVLLRTDPARLASRPAVSPDVPEGFLAYSKLCTHMGCPVGLFQQDPDVLVCPCHQAVFDVFDGARPVQGPASRPLPQLPLTVGEDGVLRADGEFSDAVGPGWWGRPR